MSEVAFVDLVEQLIEEVIEAGGDVDDAVDELRTRAVEDAEVAKLGRRQRTILLKCYLRAGKAGSQVVRWLHRPQTLAEAKANSRALRDLERRGLLTRLGRDREPGLPTFYVRLTLAGLVTARLERERAAA